jgi:hypothetical protein
MSLRQQPWPGMRQDVTDLGDGPLDVVNVKYRKQGELQRRPGLGTRYALSATQLGFLSSVGGNHLIGYDGTTLTSLNMDTGATTSLATGLTAVRGTFALANGALYYANGTDAVRVIYRGDQASVAAGIVAPASAPTASATSGNCTRGAHLIRFRWKNSVTGYYSNPSPALAYDNSPGVVSTTVTVTNGSTSVTFATAVPNYAYATIVINGVDAGPIDPTGTTSATLDVAWSGETGSYPCTVTQIFSAGSSGIALTLGTTADAKVDKMVIEMTEVDGSTFYVVDTVNDGSAYTINIADSALNQQQLADVYAAPDGFGHEPPPSGLRVITSSRNRIFGLDATGTLYWSRAAYPEAFNVLEWAQRVFSNGGDKAVALGNFMSDIYVFGQRSMARLVYNGDPSSGMFAQMPTSFGVWNQNCVVEVEGSLWGWGRQGIFRITEIQPKFMSAPVGTTLRTDTDVTGSDAFFAFYDTQERVLWFCYKAIGDTGVRRAVCYDLQTREWHRRTLRHQINHAIIAGDATRDDYAYLADDDGGYTWRLEDDRFDGVPTSMPNGVITSDVGSSTTVINTLESVADVVGAILYDPSNGEERRITGSTASTVTLASALTNAPVVGSQYWIGSIPVMYRSQWVPVSYVYEGRRPSYLELLHLSTTSGVVMDVTYYVDYSATPTTWTRVADDAMMNGLTITNGATYATQDVSAGKNTVPVPADFSLTLQFKLDQAKPLGTFRLLNASFLWNDQRGAKEVGN